MIKVNNWLNSIQDWLFPPTCILCGHPGLVGLDMCYTCHRHLPRNTSHCQRCAEIIPPMPTATLLCGRCLARTPAFDKVYAPFLHQDEIRYLVTGLKFAKQYKNARLLGGLLAEHLKATAEMPDVIIPVPLHPSRYRERGFNQAVEIARTVSKILAIKLDQTSCIRNKATPHQTGLTAKKREQNMKRAFTLTKPMDASHVAILDDVMTTGSTADALARELKRGGVARVDIWVCSRA